MNVNLPIPPGNPFLQRLIAKLTEIFRKVRPASGWKDKEALIWAAQGQGANAPSWTTFRDGIKAWQFSATSEKELWVAFHMPHDMALAYTDETGAATGPMLYPHVHYASNSVTPSTGTVRWGFEWTYADGYGTEVFPTTQTLYIEHTPTGTQYMHEISEVSEADAIQDGFETDGLFLMRFFRDAAHANDTNTDNLHVFAVDMHYLSDGLQTVERNRGTGTPPWHKQNPL